MAHCSSIVAKSGFRTTQPFLSPFGHGDKRMPPILVHPGSGSRLGADAARIHRPLGFQRIEAGPYTFLRYPRNPTVDGPVTIDHISHMNEPATSVSGVVQPHTPRLFRLLSADRRLSTSPYADGPIIKSAYERVGNFLCGADIVVFPSQKRPLDVSTSARKCFRV